MASYYTVIESQKALEASLFKKMSEFEKQLKSTAVSSVSIGSLHDEFNCFKEQVWAILNILRQQIADISRVVDNERSLLLEILKDFKHIIENKKTDNVSAAVKKQTWAEIAERYNTSAIVSESASGEQLRRLWTNLKTRQKDALTRERKYRLATGGGGSCPDAEDKQSRLLEIPNAIDSDSTDIPASTNLSPSTDESTSPSVILQSNVSPSIVQPQPSTIQDPENHIIQPKQPQTSTSFEFSSHEKKIRVQVLRQEHINRERRADEIHTITLQHKKEIHELEVKILKEKLKEAIARAESVHKHM